MAILDRSVSTLFQLTVSQFVETLTVNTDVMRQKAAAVMSDRASAHFEACGFCRRRPSCGRMEVVLFCFRQATRIFCAPRRQMT